MPEQVIVDATDHIAGRLCSYVAKMLLKGSDVVVLNAEKTMLSGSRDSAVRQWHEYLEIGSIVHPKHGPFHSRRPDTIITRMVRGMVPWDQPKGKNAMKRLRVYVGMPKDYEGTQPIQFNDAKIRRSAAYYTSMGDLAGLIGWKA